MAVQFSNTNGHSDESEPTRSHDPHRTSEPTRLSVQQLADLTDAGKQAEYRRAYHLQLQRQACPGCGDDLVVFASNQPSADGAERTSSQLDEVVPPNLHE